MERYTQTSNSRCTSGRSVLLDIDDALERLSNNSNPVNRMHVTVKRSSTAIPEMAPNRVFSQYRITSPISVQTFPAAISSRRVTNYKSKLLSANNVKIPLPAFKRSKTVLSTPCRHCDACSIKHLRNFSKLHSGTGIRIETGMMLQGMKRSKSDLQIHDDELRMMSTGLKTGERAPVFIMGTSQEPRAEAVGANKEEVMLPTAIVPKKGLIKLTALDQEILDPEMFYNKQLDAGGKPDKKRGEQQKSLIKRKDIRDQIREGARLLEEEEMRKNLPEEEEAHIEDYTLGELQSVMDFVMDGSDARRESIAHSVEKKEQQKAQKIPKNPQVTESIKQQTFQLPMLGQKK